MALLLMIDYLSQTDLIYVSYEGICLTKEFF